ncbi:hypothetical protein HK102_009741 [Quaeritorhiza haematococci]|nr:hypothetical protein HK102_009741 [Quaeritorhiza haematococci]
MAESDIVINDVTALNQETPETGGISDEQSATIIVVSNILNSISIFACICVIACFGIGWFYNRKLIRRVSLRLTLAVIIAELIYHVFQIFSNNYVNDDGWCALSVFGYIVFALLSTFLNLCIGVNLQIVFVFNRRFKLPGETTTIIWKWVSFYGPTCLAILYGSVITVQVWSKLLMTQRKVRSAGVNNLQSPSNGGAAVPSARPAIGVGGVAGNLGDTGRRKSLANVHKLAEKNGSNRNVVAKITEDVLRKLASRVIFYPLIPLLGQMFNIATDLTTYINNQQHYELLLVSYIATSIQGTFTAIIFFTCDPVFNKIKQAVFNENPTLFALLSCFRIGAAGDEMDGDERNSGPPTVSAPWGETGRGRMVSTGSVFEGLYVLDVFGDKGEGAGIWLQEKEKAPTKDHQDEEDERF